MPSSMHLPIEIYDILERHYGHEDSRQVAKAIEDSLSLLEARSIDLAQQRKLEIIDQMRGELVTRDYLDMKLELLRKEMDVLRKEMKADLHQIDKKFTVYFLVVLFAVLFVNKDAITLLGKLLGLVRP